MRTKSLIATILAGLFLVCSYEDDAVLSFDGTRSTDADALGVDIVQRTCALEVVLAVHDIAGLLPVDHDRDTSPIPLEARPGGTMLACTPAPTGQHASPDDRIR